jgi:hypothetical protein
MRATRYKLIPGDQIWIVDREDTRHNPVFVLAGNDLKFARELLRRLNDPAYRQKMLEAETLEQEVAAK